MSRLVEEYRRGVLRESDLFGALDEAEIERLLAAASIHSAQKKELLVRKGDAPDRLYGLLSGRASVMGISADGKEIAIRLIEPGEVFGEIALLDGLPRTADVVAVERSDYFTLLRADFETFVLQHPKAGLRLMGILARRLRLTSEMLEDVAFLPLRERLAKMFLRMASRYGADSPAGRRIGLRLPVRMIAEMVGSTRETTNLMILEWEQAGWLAREDRYFILRDSAALEAIASRDAAA